MALLAALVGVGIVTLSGPRVSMNPLAQMHDGVLEGADYWNSIDDDARLVDEYIRDIAGLREFALLSHDKGDSVGLALLRIYQAYDEKPYQIKHHFITNGRIYLPLAQLTTSQKALLNPIIGPLISPLMTGTRAAENLADLTFATTLPQSEIDSYASIFNYQNGMAVMHEITEYLNERSEYEALSLALGRTVKELQMLMGMLIEEWKRQAGEIMGRFGYQVRW